MNGWIRWTALPMGLGLMLATMVMLSPEPASAGNLLDAEVVELPTAEVTSCKAVTPSTGTLESLSAVAVSGGVSAAMDCAKGCQNAAKIAEEEGDPVGEVLARLHKCLDRCRL